jgi:heme A synthase
VHSHDADGPAEPAGGQGGTAPGTRTGGPDLHDPGGPGAAPRYVIVLAFLAALFYASFFLENWLSPDLDVVNGYVSELSAIDQPFHLVYSGGDLITGILSIIVSAGTLRRLRRRPLATAGWAFLGLFGIWAIGDASFPLDCAPNLETWCALRERSEHVSFSHEFHSVTSTVVITCGVIALFLLSLAARRYGWWPVLARWGWVVAAAETVFALSTLLAMYLGRWLGIIQRVQISVLCAGLLLIAWALYIDRRNAGRTPASPPPLREKTCL